MTGRGATFGLVLLAALAVTGCERRIETHVLSAGPSLPDDAVLRPPAAGAAAVAQHPGGSDLPAAVPDTRVAGAAPATRRPPGDLGDARGAQLLAQRALQVPVAGIAPAQLRDTFREGRGARQHEALDILAPAGTPVVAVDDGRIAKLFASKPGGLTIYQFDPQQHLAYYYAHLQRYAPGVSEGQQVRRGEVIGYVGSTGNADAGTPHLHFAVFRLGTPAKWWQGEPVNPYPQLRRAQPTASVAAR